MARVNVLPLSVAFLVFASTASANAISIHLGAAATTIGPNLSNFDTVASPGIDLALNLLPGVPQSVAFYDLNFTPSCAAAVCNGVFVRGLNFGFVTAQDATAPGSGSGTYIQDLRDTITNANSAGSSHVLSASPAGAIVIDLSNGERLSITVPSQTFDSFGSGDAAVSLGVGGSFLLTTAAAPVPEPSAVHMVIGGFMVLVLTRRRL